MAYNAEKRRQYHENAKQKKALLKNASMGITGAEPVGGADAAAPVVEPALTIEVKTETPRKLSLRERLGWGKQATTPVKQTGKGKQATSPNLIVTVLPTVLAALIAAYAKDRIPVEYQPCAPSKQEVQAVLGPLMNILGRRVEIAAKASQDVIDLSNALICTMAYGVRAYVTYVDIKKASEQGISYEQQKQQRADEYRKRIEREAAEYDAVVREDQAASNGTNRDSVGGTGSRSGVSVDGTASHGAGNLSDDQQLRSYEAGLVAQMFARDRGGRVRLGLLPG